MIVAKEAIVHFGKRPMTGHCVPCSRVSGRCIGDVAFTANGDTASVHGEVPLLFLL